jgi:hypothetical protein
MRSAGRGASGGALAAAGLQLHGAGCLRSHRCLRSLSWQSSRGDGAGDRSPRPAAGQAARSAKGKAPGRDMARVPAMTSRAPAGQNPAGGPDLGRRARQGSRGRQGSPRRRSRQEFLPPQAGLGAGRARTPCRASLVRVRPARASLVPVLLSARVSAVRVSVVRRSPARASLVRVSVVPVLPARASLARASPVKASLARKLSRREGSMRPPGP